MDVKKDLSRWDFINLSASFIQLSLSKPPRLIEVIGLVGVSPQYFLSFERQENDKKWNNVVATWVSQMTTESFVAIANTILYGKLIGSLTLRSPVAFGWNSTGQNLMATTGCVNHTYKIGEKSADCRKLNLHHSHIALASFTMTDRKQAHHDWQNLS